MVVRGALLPLFLVALVAPLFLAAPLAGPITATIETERAAPAPGLFVPYYRTQSHVDTPTADLYVAETLTSALWSTGATKERFLGRPFWIEPLTGRDVRVAIIDTGIDPDHPDLSGRVVAWRDFLQGRPEPYDDDTHGTHVAGIIAAHGHLQVRPDRHYFPFGARGVAPDVQLLVAKAMDTNGDGDAADVAAAIRWALDPNGDGDYSDGAHVINLSIGLETAPRRGDDDTIRTPVTVPAFRTDQTEEARAVRLAIQTAVRAGAIVVVAAGNHEPGAPQSTVTFPGTMKEVITVGALDADGRVAAFSNTGEPGSGKPDLVAPGVLLSTFPRARDDADSRRDGYVALGGTSMSAPLVSGTVALMLEGEPTLRRLSATEDLSWHSREVRNVLVATAEGSAYDPTSGYGRLRTDAAVAAVDQGQGPVNWDTLLLLTLLALAVVGLVVRRKRSAARDRALRRARAEARARLAAAEPSPGGETPEDPDASVPTEPDTSSWPHTPTEPPVPEWQRPPWEPHDDRP